MYILYCRWKEKSEWFSCTKFETECVEIKVTCRKCYWKKNNSNFVMKSSQWTLKTELNNCKLKCLKILPLSHLLSEWRHVVQYIWKVWNLFFISDMYTSHPPCSLILNCKFITMEPWKDKKLNLNEECYQQENFTLHFIDVSTKIFKRSLLSRRQNSSVFNLKISKFITWCTCKINQDMSTTTIFRFIAV